MLGGYVWWHNAFEAKTVHNFLSHIKLYIDTGVFQKYEFHIFSNLILLWPKENKFLWILWSTTNWRYDSFFAPSFISLSKLNIICVDVIQITVAGTTGIIQCSDWCSYYYEQNWKKSLFTYWHSEIQYCYDAWTYHRNYLTCFFVMISKHIHRHLWCVAAGALVLLFSTVMISIHSGSWREYIDMKLQLQGTMNQPLVITNIFNVFNVLLFLVAQKFLAKLSEQLFVHSKISSKSCE